MADLATATRISSQFYKIIWNKRNKQEIAHAKIKKNKSKKKKTYQFSALGSLLAQLSVLARLLADQSSSCYVRWPAI